MKIFDNLDDIKNIDETFIALGNFDGIHLGHQEIIKKCVSKAKENNFKSGVFTFLNHPKNYKSDATDVKNILSQKDKIDLISELGVDYLFNIRFDKDILNMRALDFINNILVDKLNVKSVFCGFNYRFGYKAEGDIPLLKSQGLKKGFEIDVTDPIKIGGEIVSSSHIRGLILKGEVDKVYDFLGRHFSVTGEVVVGNKFGRTIGFPTSNLLIDESMVTPPNGVYATNCIYDGKEYESVTNVGVKPTIGDYMKNIETHMFNFDKELYGQSIRVEFLKEHRAETAFSSIEELKDAISNDCEWAKKLHDNIK